VKPDYSRCEEISTGQYQELHRNRRFGRIGSPAHKTIVVSDTVGDPLKDTDIPSLDILTKLMAMISVIFAAFLVAMGD